MFTHATRPLFSRHAAALLLAAPLATAHADVLINNLDQPVHNVAVLRSDFWHAQSFLTPAGSPLTLDMVTARVGVLTGTPGLVVELRADAAGQPGAWMANLSTALIGSGPTVSTPLAPPGGITLAPESTYWLLLGATGSGGFDWAYAGGNAASGSGSFYQYTYTVDQGLNWIGFGTEGPFLMRVDVSAVPEPMTWAMFAAGLAAIGLRHRRRG